MSNGSAVLGLAARLPSLARRAKNALVRRVHRVDEPPAALRGLSPAAKALLRQLLRDGGRTLRAPAVADAAIGLELREVIAIYRDPGAGPRGAFVLALNDWALEPLRRHPDLLV